MARPAEEIVGEVAINNWKSIKLLEKDCWEQLLFRRKDSRHCEVGIPAEMEFDAAREFDAFAKIFP